MSSIFNDGAVVASFWEEFPFLIDFLMVTEIALFSFFLPQFLSLMEVGVHLVNLAEKLLVTYAGYRKFIKKNEKYKKKRENITHQQFLL